MSRDAINIITQMVVWTLIVSAEVIVTIKFFGDGNVVLGGMWTVIAMAGLATQVAVARRLYWVARLTVFEERRNRYRASEWN